MATHFQPYCDDCKQLGPTLRHNGSGVFLWPTLPNERMHIAHMPDDGQYSWDKFLSEHEFHEMRLVREGNW